MKKSILLIAILLRGFAGFAQNWPTDKNISYVTGPTLLKVAPTYILKPLYYFFTGEVNGNVVLKVEIPKNKIPFDSLIAHVRKSDLRWLNDSTAIIKKTNQ